MDSTAIATIIGATCAGAGILIGAFGKVLYDRRKEDNATSLARRRIADEEMTAEDSRADNWAKQMIVLLQTDLNNLRAEFNQLRADHLNCERTAAEQRAVSSALQAEVDVLRKHLSEKIK